MSDEDNFMCDEEDYGLEYSSDSGSEPEVELENQYYASKALCDTDPEAALLGFAKVVAMQEEKGDWGFRAVKQMVKLNFRLGRYDAMMEKYTELLTYLRGAVTRNYSEKSISSILDHLSASGQMALLQDVYSATLDALVHAKNDRLWFKTSLKLGKLCFDRREFGRLSKIIKQLHASCQTESGAEDDKKGTQLLEIYALEIQMYTVQKNSKRLAALYESALQVRSAIPHPLIMGVIRECGGKMHMAEGQWEAAHTDFFEAFKNFDESGSPRRTQSLKYLVLANMLMCSDINPFDSQEAKPYRNDSEIVAMTNLVAAYQRNDIKEFESILQQNRTTIMEDDYMRHYIEDLLRNIRTQVLLKLIKPYTHLSLAFVSTALNIPLADVEALLVGLILDEKINGQIDQIKQLLVLRPNEQGAGRYQALDQWQTHVGCVMDTCLKHVC